MRRSLIVGLTAAAFSVILLPSCVSATCEDKGTCGSPSANDGGPNDGSSPSCDPLTDSSCIDEKSGIFVNAAADANGDGTRSRPFRKITDAIAKVSAMTPNVYVCDGSYPENVVISGGTNLLGNLNCDWSPNGSIKPKIAPASGIALSIRGSGVASVTGFDINATADANKKGESAIAAFVTETTTTFLRVSLTAGGGTQGLDGGTKENFTEAAAKAGKKFDLTNGGASQTCTCSDASSSTGGQGGAADGTGLSDGSASPAVGSPNGGANRPSACDPGAVGANGLAGGEGSVAAAVASITATGWVVSAPTTSGPSGHPGQGGGGGGTKMNSSSPGGGGGCGGCGGGGGADGSAGGSSFALLVDRAAVTIKDSSLVSGAGGRGGRGGNGQAGQAGGDAGVGNACDGGKGGNGAGGTGGSGGPGGHSIPVAYKGGAPTLVGGTQTVGSKGLGGDGGDAGTAPGGAGNPGSHGKAGADGLSAATSAFN